MARSSERPGTGGLGRVVWALAAYILFAPAALIALPLAALLAVSRPRTGMELVVAGGAAGYALWWLLVPGTLPDQLVRAAAVLATVVFVVVTVRTRSSFTHRALAALGSATVGLYVLIPALGHSWRELRWWVSHETGIAARGVMGQLWLATRPGVADPAPDVRNTLTQLETAFTQFVEITAEFYPAIVALQLLAGLAVATALYHRVARTPKGAMLGRLREFRFTDHLGWAAAVPLVVVVLPKVAAVKTAAANLLVVTGVLYAVRGVAVAAFGLHLMGGAGMLLGVVTTIVILLMLPVVVGGTILLGVLDAGLDLRRRWATPRTGE